MKKPGYPIRAVSKMTGLSIDTLRAWERRYQAVSPERQGKGRVYSEADVQKLRLLRANVERGYSIGQLARLSEQELKEVAGQTEKLAEPGGAEAGTGVSPPSGFKLTPVLTAIERFDYLAADFELSRLAAVLSVRQLVHKVVMPLMREVGERWHSGNLSIAQEHLTSSIMRNLLGGLMRLYARESASRRFLFTTPSGEGHEFGILAAAMLAAGGGLGVIYLGVSLPAGEILEAVRKTAVDVVVLGIKGAGEPHLALDELRQVAAGLPSKVELWVGGTTSENLTREIRETRAIFIPDFQALDKQLVRLGAMF